MTPDAIREVLAHYVAGNPCESISFGATVTIVCTTEVAAHRWRTFCPNGVLPRSLTPVQVVTMWGAAS